VAEPMAILEEGNMSNRKKLNIKKKIKIMEMVIVTNTVTVRVQFGVRDLIETNAVTVKLTLVMLLVMAVMLMEVLLVGIKEVVMIGAKPLGVVKL